MSGFRFRRFQVPNVRYEVEVLRPEDKRELPKEWWNVDNTDETDKPEVVEIPAGLKSGFKTSEFWLTVVAMLGAFFLASRGCEGLATTLFAIAGVSYKASRTIVKSVAAKAAALFLLLALTAGCSSPGKIKAAAIEDDLRIVLDRHDGYVKADAGLDPGKRETALRSSTLLRSVLDEALGKKPVADPGAK